MALHLHRAERTDLLADGLADLLAQSPSDPFAQELVLVPAKGVERWLSQRLSNRLGVCAAVEFRNPRSLIAELTGTADIASTAGTAGDDPWSADAMAWPLLSVIDDNLDQPWCAAVATHLGHFEIGDEHELRQGRRYAVARRLAGLFASYARQRPQLLVDWAGLPDDLSWQAPLWQALVERIDAEPPHIRHAKTLARLTESPSDLPERLSLFGHTRLPVTEIELLSALATHHDLHLWLPHPSDDLWQSLANHTGRLARREDSSHRDVGHPLLATLGRDLRELQRGLPIPDTDEYLSGTGYPDTVLGWLQSDIAADAIRPAGRVPRRADRSIQVHSCHGPARQIEVLREVLLGLLADDPTLEPRDILVMCPDIETYAPLITAGFGLGDVVPRTGGAQISLGAHPAHKLRVRLADRALVQTNPLLSVAASVLALAGGRATASEVLNLAGSAPVRARFGFTDDDLEAITAWVREANIRWGFDQEHRRPYGVEFLHNTWRFGIDRVLAGVAMSDDSHAWLGTTLPLDDVSSNRVELAGRFADFVEKLRVTVDALSGVRPLGEWLSALSAGIDVLAYSDEEWPAAQVQREFAEIGKAAGAAQTPMRLSDIRALLDRHLAGRPTRANFRTGTLTVCTMVPMRSVPHRVVCLVGLDDGVFPRLGAVDGDDVLARDPRTGERDIRSEDRQLLLDAIGATTQTLVVTYTGANEYSGQARPPAVPLAELLDTLKITTEQPVDVVTTHPLQPFDIRNVTPGALQPDGPFTFDPTALTAAQASAGQRAERPAFFGHQLPPPPADDVALEDLVTFFKDPVKGFFRALDYTLPWDVDGVSDAMPVDIDALEEWTVGDRMLGDILRGMTPADAQQAEWRRGTLPPGQLGWRRAIALRDQCALLAAEALRYRAADPQAYDVDIDLGTRRRLAGTVSPAFGDRLVSVTYSKLDGKHLLQSWIPLLALAVGYPDRDWSAVCIGRPRRGDAPRVEGLGRPDNPVELLADLVAIYDAGRREPLPLPVKTSYAWAAARHAGDDPEREAGFRWRSSRFPGEDEAPAHVRAWGRGAPLSRLVGLGEYAERLWLPVLQAQLQAERSAQ